MLRHGETVFLDDLTVADVERELGVQVVLVPQDGAELLFAMLNEKEVPAEKAEPGDIVYNKEQLNKIYHEVFGENLGKDSKGK